MNIIKQFDSIAEKSLKMIPVPTIIKGLVHLLLVLYVVRLAPQPPKPVLDLFENVYFKLFIFSLVLWTAQFSPSTSILISLAFLVTMNYVNTGKVWEFLENVPAQEKQAVESVKVLADAALSPMAVPAEVVTPVAEIAAAVAGSEGQKAIEDLKVQATVPEAGDVAKVQQAVDIAMDSIVSKKKEVTGCYPLRKYDMSKVSSDVSGDLHEFKVTPQ